MEFSKGLRWVLCGRREHSLLATLNMISIFQGLLGCGRRYENVPKVACCGRLLTPSLLRNTQAGGFSERAGLASVWYPYSGISTRYTIWHDSLTVIWEYMVEEDTKRKDMCFNGSGEDRYTSQTHMRAWHSRVSLHKDSTKLAHMCKFLLSVWNRSPPRLSANLFQPPSVVAYTFISGGLWLNPSCAN